MAVRKWLRGLFGMGPEVVGRSAGGSRLLKYDGGEFDKPQVGFTDEATDELVKRRETVYEATFGAIGSVYHEMVPFLPHVDVYQFPPNDTRQFFTFLTGGMSDLPMNSPAKLGREYRRVELVFYATEEKLEYLEFLRRLAHFPHDNRTWLHWGHTMPNGTPPEPVFGSSHLDSLFFMPSIVRPDSQLGERLEWRREPINLVWCVPITSAECELKLAQGTDALYDLFEARQHPFVFRGDRESYV